MKILIIRHADPDYAKDSLTDKGWLEAEYLSQKMELIPVKDYYVSPLGRARDTASLTLKKAHKEAKILDWLTEFVECTIKRPDRTDRRMIAWDWLPEDWTVRENFFDSEKWMDEPEMTEGGVGAKAQWVWDRLDALLASYGYVRDGRMYRAEHPNNDTIVLFCHFGVECVLLSHLMNVSPMVIWHGVCAAPSSVTTLVTEERRPGKAIFRMTSFGDTSHLYVHDEKPAVAARFCECYENEGERRD